MSIVIRLSVDEVRSSELFVVIHFLICGVSKKFHKGYEDFNINFTVFFISCFNISYVNVWIIH